MKKKKTLLYAVIAGANALSLAAALALSLAGGAIARSQSYNRAAQKWDRDGKSTQISCFFPDDNSFTTDSVNALRVKLRNELTAVAADPNGKIPTMPDAYSTSIGHSYITCDTLGKGEADITAVDGDFFIFRDFKLLSGAYFSKDDIMQDGAVIEKSLAWSLYGSSNIAGQLIYIDGIQFYVSGVIDDPSDKYEKKSADENPRVYISYEGAESLPQVMYSPSRFDDYSDYGMSSQPKLSKVSCYECIIYDPVENFAYSTVKKYFKDMNATNISIVNNTERFSPSVMAKSYKKRSDSVIRKDTVVFPYWENASRIAEFKLAPIYFWRTICFVLPIITAILLIWMGFRFIKKHGLNAISALIEKHKKAAYNRQQKKDYINSN